MKALILAAGLGSRLAPITDKVPKSLVKVNGKSILIKQIENLHKNGIYDITIITGYKSEVIENIIKTDYPNINVIKSENYETTNNMYSAYLAKDIIGKNNFLMMNADVFFDSSIITSLLNYKSENAIVVDINNYLDESMKVIENNGKLVEISKKISKDDALGVSIDVYKFSSEAGQKFFNQCNDYIVNKKEINLWSEIALNDILKNTEFHACPLNGKWVEIDNHNDLEFAERLFTNE